MNRRKKGNHYEQRAKEYLESQGYEIQTCNFYTRYGEIDIIAKQGETTVFVEVKYRKNLKSGYPQEAVTPGKQKKIRTAARYYLYQQRVEDVPCRFDVIAILDGEITHIKNAF